MANNRGSCMVTANIGSTYIKNTCIGNTCNMDVYIKYANFRGFCTRGIVIKRIYIKNICISSAGIVERLRIYL